jgi:hypothetical protein
MKSLKRLTKKIIIKYCRNNGIKYDNDKDIEFLNSDNILSSLGEKQKKSGKKIKFNLDGSKLSNQNMPQSPKFPKKPCLKVKNEEANSDITNLDDEIIKRRNSLKEPQIMEPENNKGFIIQINGVQMKRTNTLANLIRKANSGSTKLKNIKNNIYDNPSTNDYCRIKTVKIKNKMIPKNNGDNESTSTFKKKKSNLIGNSTKIIKRQETNDRNSNLYSTKIIKKQQAIVKTEESIPYARMNSNVAMRSNSYHNKKLYKIDSDGFFSGFKVNDPNIKDTKIMFNNKMKTIIQKKLNKSDDEDDENPKTIKNLSKQLMKKIQKK